MFIRGPPICYDTPLSAGISTAVLIIGIGLSLLAVFKMFNLINILKTVLETKPLLPLDRFDYPTIGTASGIKRSTSDGSLAQRYMSPRDSPLPGGYFRGPSLPPTPRIVHQEEGSPSTQSEAFALRLPASLAEPLLQQEV